MRVALVVLGLLLSPAGWTQPRLRLETGIGHMSSLTALCISPGGKSVLTASNDKTARLWDADSGKEVRRFDGYGEPVVSATFSPDGKSVLLASGNTVRLWAVATGSVVREFQGHSSLVMSAVFSKDGKSILTASWDSTARLWDAATGKEIRSFRGHERPINSASFSPDGKSALTASIDKTARLWDLTTGMETQRFEGHRKEVSNAVFSSDGNKVLTASSDETVRLWDSRTGKETGKFEGLGADLRYPTFSPDGGRILIACGDHTARLLDIASGKEVRRFECYGFGGSTPVIFYPDGKSILIVFEDRVARRLDVATRQEVKRFEGQGTSVFSAVFSHEGTNILSANEDAANLWDATAGRETQRFIVSENQVGGFFPPTVRTAVFSPDDKFVLSGNNDGTARLWETSTGRQLSHVRGNGGSVNSATFSPDSKSILIARGLTAAFCDIASGKETHKFFGHRDGVTSAVFSPNGKLVLTASWDHTARLWDADSGKEVRRFEGHGDPVTDATFSPDGSQVLTASWDQTARLWDAVSGNEVRQFTGHRDIVNNAVFCPDGSLVLTASDDNSARMWDAGSGKAIRDFKGHGYFVTTATFSPDARKVLTTSADGTTRIWDTGTGKGLCALISYRDGSWAVVDPEGRYDSSNGGQNPNLYWVYEDPAKGILDTVGVDQIGSYFYTPGLLAKCMTREKLPQVENLDKLPIFPKVDNLTIDKTKVTFTLTDRGGGIGQVKAFVDGQLVKTIQGKSGKNTLELETEGQDIQIVAYNGKNNLASPRSTTTSPPPVNVTTPTRYVAVIAGIETYAGPGLKPLNFAADDAVAIARSVLACAKGLKITPDIYVLSSAPEAQDLKKEGITVLPATKAAFKEVFTKILPAGGKWRDSDLMFLYFSGHGGSYKEGNLSHYAYYTEDARDADLSIKRDEWAVTDVELVEWLAKFPGGKRAMVLDTCAAGAATELLAQAKDDADRERAMLDTNRNTGMSVLFGSAESAASWESNGHGLLTYSILQALATQQDLGEGLKDAIRVDTLFSRAEGDTRKEAERLGLKQEPRKFGRGQNFPIGFLDDAGRKSIPYQSPVPLFGKPSLINSATGLDDLDLMAQLGDALRRSSQPKSGEPLPLRYVPDSPAAVQIQGAYTISGDRVTVIMNLLEKGKAPVPLKVEATKQDLVDAAVRAIITWARGKAM